MSDETREKNLAAKNMAERPKWITQEIRSSKTDIDCLLESMASAEKEILKKYRHSPATPKNHAYEMASLGDETMDDLQEKILKRDKETKEASDSNRDIGAKAVHENAMSRAEEICRINRILLERLKPYGPLSLSDIATKIIQDWYEIPLASKLPGEPSLLKRRGIDGPPPSARTIKNYIQAASLNAHQRVGKTSLKKK